MAQQRLFIILKIILYAVVVISEVLHLSTKNHCSRCYMAHLYLFLCGREEEGEACPNCREKRMRVRTRLRQLFWEIVKNTPPAPRLPRPYNRCKELRAIKLAEETNEIMREIIEDRWWYQLIGIKGFIGPLPRPIGLFDESVRERRRVWALPSLFLDPLYRRDIVSPFPVL